MKASQHLVGHVISHTHWDRAWYLPFEMFRIRLVKLISKLLDLLERDQTYRFWLDGQTVPVDDYLEIHPQDRARIEKLVRAKRLFVGPLYVVPDIFLITGETLIRDYRIGMQVSAALGHTPPVGTLSDVFGYPAQVPQILRGVGLDNAVLHRGVSAQDKMNGWVREWFAPDGSSVTLVLCAGWGYANLFYWGVDAYSGKTVPTPPTDMRNWSLDLADEQLSWTLKEYRTQGKLTSRHVYLGNGVDHQEAQPHTPDLVRGLNRRRADVTLKHSTYEDLLAGIRAEKKKFPPIHGLLKHCDLHGTLTSRVYLKQAMRRIAGRTEMLLEPLLALADRYGRGWRFFRETHLPLYATNPGQNWAELPFYPAGQVEHLWKLLLKNAPHDDICGCSVDAVHRDMENTFKRADEISSYLIQDAMTILSHRKLAGAPDATLPHLVVFNPHPFAVHDAIGAEVFIPGTGAANDIGVVDEMGAPVAAVVESAEKFAQINFDGMNFLDPIQGTQATIRFAAPLPPGSLTALRLVRHTNKNAVKPVAQAFRRGQAAVVRNACNEIVFHPNGSFDVKDFATGHTFRSLGLLEDVEDCGHSYTHKRFNKSRPVSAQNARGQVAILSHNDLVTQVRVRLTLRVPESLGKTAGQRSSKNVPLKIEILHAIHHTRPGGRMRVTFDNTARDHELYLTFPTGLHTNQFGYDAMFGFDRYAIGEKYGRIDSVALVAAGARALAVVGDCPTLAMSRHDKRGRAEIGISLVRSVGWVNEIRLESWRAAEAQCLRTIDRNFAWTTGNPAAVRAAALELRRLLIAPPLVEVLTPAAKRVYRDPGHATANLPADSFLRVAGQDLHLSCWKRADDGNGWIVRLYSLAAKQQIIRITVAGGLRQAHRCNLLEKTAQPLKVNKDGAVQTRIRPKEILTLRLHPK